MPAQDAKRGRRSPEGLAANRPMAVALRLARGSATQREFVDALRAAGYPATEDQVSAWELGADPHTVASINGITVVPAWALIGGAKVSGRTVAELLTAAGVEGQDPFSDQLDQLRRQLAELRADVDTWLVDRKELRSRVGMEDVEFPLRLHEQERESGS